MARGTSTCKCVGKQTSMVLLRPQRAGPKANLQMINKCCLAVARISLLLKIFVNKHSITVYTCSQFQAYRLGPDLQVAKPAGLVAMGAYRLNNNNNTQPLDCHPYQNPHSLNSAHPADDPGKEGC